MSHAHRAVVVHCREHGAGERIGLGLVRQIITGNTPACIERDGRYREIPALSEPSVAAIAVVADGEGWSHAVTCRRHLKSILHVCRATVVRRRRCDDVEFRRRICRLDVVHHGGCKAVGLRGFRCLYDTVDHVGEVRGLGFHVCQFLVYLHPFESHPVPLFGIVVKRAYVILRVTARYSRAVILQTYGGTIFRKVRAVGQEAVAVALAGDIAHGKVQFRQVRTVHRTDGKVYRTQQPSLCHGKSAAGYGNAVRLCRGKVFADGSVGSDRAVFCLGLFRLIVRNRFFRLCVVGCKLFLLLRRRIAAFRSRRSGRCAGGVSRYVCTAVFLS